MKAITPPTGSSSRDTNGGQAADAPPPSGPSLGLEIEMPVACAHTGASGLQQSYFASLESLKAARGEACTPQMLEGRCIALHTPQADCGLDNGHNLLETALAPVLQGGLAEMSRRAHQELGDSISALEHEDACILSVSQHPDCPRDADWYAQACVPRPIYHELLARGWHHWEGIDAKAQNGANTGVAIKNAIAALNVMIALAPANIALFANSPLECGRPTGLKESRMMIWPRVFRHARYECDRRMATYPSRPFADFADFFTWMSGHGTTTRALPLQVDGDYKVVSTVMPDGAPSLYALLHQESWPARTVLEGAACVLRPQSRHFEYGQIAQFLDARLRYRWTYAPERATLLHAWDTGELEALFEACGADMYIEARAPGATFADESIMKEAGLAVADSVLMAPLALQTGLITQLEAATQLVHDWGWERLGNLRERAIQYGMDDDQVHALCRDVLAVASKGMAPQDRQWLAYAEYVLQSRRTGADRLLDSWNGRSEDGYTGLAAVLRHHRARHPAEYGRTGGR